MALKIDAARCPQNHRCPLLTVCLVETISQQGYEPPVIDVEKCLECDKYIKYCGTGVIYKDKFNGKTV